MKTFTLTALAFLLAACTAAETPAPEVVAAEPDKKIGAYIIVSGKDYDLKKLQTYSAELPPIYEKYGGWYVAFSNDYSTLEGQPDADAIIISAWPSVEAAKTFWASPEYTEAKKLREGNGTFEVVILPALPHR